MRINTYPYKAIIFDLHGTLIPWCKDGFQVLLEDIANILQVDKDAFADAMDAMSQEAMVGRFGSTADQIIHTCRTIEANPSPEAIQHAAELWTNFHRHSFENPYPGAFVLLQQLKNDGLKTGLITNCNWEAPELWPNSSLAPFVDVAVFSVIEGIAKPNIEIFKRACERLGTSSRECAYVDDSVEYLSGAASVGMHPILVRHPDNQLGLSRLNEWTGVRVSDLKEIAALVFRESCS